MLPYLSIIIPVHNEAGRLSACLKRLTLYIWDFTHYRAEILVVDNGSTDDTQAIANRWAELWDMVKVHHIPERSKALAVKKGMLAARGAYRMMMDVDLATPPEQIPDFLEAMQGHDLAIGCRYMPGAVVTQSPRRALMGRIFNSLTRSLLPGIHDTQCGFKMFSAEAARWCFETLRTESMAFDVEILMQARRSRYQVAQVPVTWFEGAQSRVRLVRDTLAMVRDVWKLARDARLKAPRQVLISERRTA